MYYRANLRSILRIYVVHTGLVFAVNILESLNSFINLNSQYIVKVGQVSYAK